MFRKLFSAKLTNLNAEDETRYKLKGSFYWSEHREVYNAIDRNTGQKVAVKKLLTLEPGWEKEYELQRETDHPNIIHFLALFSKNETVDGRLQAVKYFVLEFGGDKNLQSEIDRYGNKMPHEKIAAYSFQIFHALHYLHKIRIVHGDVKPSNFALDTITWILKLCDFGSAMRVSGKKATDRGAPAYRAPELWLGCEEFSEKIDLWAAGVIIAELFLGKLPFPHLNGFGVIHGILGDPTEEDVEEIAPLSGFLNVGTQSTFDEKFSKLKPAVPASAMVLMKKLLSYRPSQRSSALEACADEFFDALRAREDCKNFFFNFNEKDVENENVERIEKIVPVKFRNDIVKAHIQNQSTKESGASAATNEGAGTSSRP